MNQPPGYTRILDCIDYDTQSSKPVSMASHAFSYIKLSNTKQTAVDILEENASAARREEPRILSGAIPARHLPYIIRDPRYTKLGNRELTNQVLTLAKKIEKKEKERTSNFKRTVNNRKVFHQKVNELRARTTLAQTQRRKLRRDILITTALETGKHKIMKMDAMSHSRPRSAVSQRWLRPDLEVVEEVSNHLGYREILSEMLKEEKANQRLSMKRFKRSESPAKKRASSKKPQIRTIGDDFWTQKSIHEWIIIYLDTSLNRNKKSVDILKNAGFRAKSCFKELDIYSILTDMKRFKPNGTSLIVIASIDCRSTILSLRRLPNYRSIPCIGVIEEDSTKEEIAAAIECGIDRSIVRDFLDKCSEFLRDLLEILVSSYNLSTTQSNNTAAKFQNLNLSKIDKLDLLINVCTKSPNEGLELLKKSLKTL